MPFQKMKANTYPLRLWALVGFPGSGKSTFAARMKGPILTIDADHRWDEVLHLNPNVYELSQTPEDNADPDRIAQLLEANMPGSGIQTIVVDSLTAIITPLVTKAIREKESGDQRNLMAGWKEKAMAMRLIQDEVTRWGVSVLWVYHLQEGRDAKANAVTKATVSATELIRLTRSINVQLQVVQDDKGKRGIKVVWARRGRSGMTLWDDAGQWLGMPEKLEAAMYDGLTEIDQQRIENSAPKVFQSPELAISWGVDQKAFKSIQHARNAYEKLKREQQPHTAEEMAGLWIASVRARLATGETNGEHDEQKELF